MRRHQKSDPERVAGRSISNESPNDFKFALAHSILYNAGFNLEAEATMNCDISWMIGQTLSEITFSEPHHWYFYFRNGGLIHAETAWRLIIAGSIKRTSEDHGQWFGLPAPVDAEAQLRSLLYDRKPNLAEIRSDTRDIILSFESGERLEILPLSSGYESWHITTPGGDEFHAQGGGNLIPFIPG